MAAAAQGRSQHSEGSAPGAESGPTGQAEGRPAARVWAGLQHLRGTVPSSPLGRGEAPPSQPGT